MTVLILLVVFGVGTEIGADIRHKRDIEIIKSVQCKDLSHE